MIPQRCTQHPEVLLRTSDQLDAHDALHIIEAAREAEAMNQARLVSIFENHGFVEVAPGVYSREQASA